MISTAIFISDMGLWEHRYSIASCMLYVVIDLEAIFSIYINKDNQK